VRVSYNRRPTQARSDEHGYILLTFLLMVTLMLIALGMAAPALKTQVKREREEELIHRGHQYAVAIRRYYKKFGRYPTKLEDLQNSNNLRFLRKVYKDPMTADGNFRLIRYGQAKTQPQGFFGQAVGQQANNAAAQAAQAAAQANTQGFSLSLPNPQSSLGSSTSGSFGTPIGGNPNDPNASGISGATNPGTPVSNMGTLQPGGATFGGGPIIGVASNSEETSLKERRGKSHYNEWEFVYDPRYDPTNRSLSGVNAGAAAAAGQQNQPTANPFGSTPGMPGMTPTPAPTPIPTPTPTPNQ
jgi:type II secretory pathway pseudopilin PulG